MTAARCVIPFMTSWPVPFTIVVPAAANAGLSATGADSVNVATGCCLVPRLAANRGCYRLRPETGITFKDLAALLDATMGGLVITAMSVPDQAEHRDSGKPVRRRRRGRMIRPALGLASIASAFIEPDPDVRWDADRVASVRNTLTTLGA